MTDALPPAHSNSRTELQGVPRSASLIAAKDTRSTTRRWIIGTIISVLGVALTVGYILLALR